LKIKACTPLPYLESLADSKNFSQTDNKKHFADAPENWGRGGAGVEYASFKIVVQIVE